MAHSILSRHGKFFLLSLLLQVPFVRIFAYDFYKDGFYYSILPANSEDDYRVCVTSQKNVRTNHGISYSKTYSGDIIIPESVTFRNIKYNVTSIGQDAFYCCTGVKSVSIPNSVTTINKYAFDGCTGMTKLDLGTGLQNISYRAFSGCEIIELNIPNSVTYIGEEAFRYCRNLTSVTIGNGVNTIGEYAFADCSDLTSVNIQDIAAWCKISFRDYHSNPLECAHHLYLNGEEIKDLIIPNNVTSISSFAFKGCSGLTSVTIPNSVKSIGDLAFSNCSGLTSVTILNSVKSIGNGAFANCSGLTSVTIPNSVTSIGESAFYKCNGLTSVSISNSVYSIGAYAFYGCSGLTSVTVPCNVRHISESTFEGCKSMVSVIIPDGVESISESAFEGCESLSSVTIPNSVKSIGYYAFKNCKGLISLSIGKGVQSIGNNGILNIIIEGSYSYVKGDAFLGCSNLTSLTLSCPNIGNWFFMTSMTSIKELVLVDGVISIGKMAFAGFSNLTSINISNSVTSIDDLAFDGCSSLTSVRIPNSVTSIGNGAFANCSGLTSVTIPNSVTSIGESAFYKCNGLTSVTIPNSVTSIGESAFYKCNGLTSVTIPNSVTSIGNGAFGNCSGLTSVTIPNSVTSIGEKTFYGCSGLTSVISLNTTPPQISNSTFSDETYELATLNVPVDCKNIYMRHSYWENFTKIEEIEGNEDISEKQALALKSYQDAMSVWDSYVYYYKGEGQTFYRTTIDKQSDNQKYIGEIFKDIERLKKQISDSSMSDDEKAFYNKTLDEIENAVYALKKENESGYYISFNDRVQEYYESFSDYYSRLEQYKERINTATTNAELDAIIAEIDADAAGMKDDYLISIIYDYNEMVGISQRLTEIGEELSKYQTKLNEITKDVKRGDANGDNAVDGKDIDEIVNYLMGKPSKSFDIKAADVNDDKIVNAADVVAIVTIIKGMYSRDFIDDGHFYGYDETGDSLIIDFEFHTNNGRCNISYRGEFDDADGLHIICGFGMLPKYDIVQIHDNVFDITFDLFCGETAKMSVFARPNGIYLHSVFFNGECKPSSLASGRSCEHLHDNINKVVGTTLLKKTD